MDLRVLAVFLAQYVVPAPVLTADAERPNIRAELQALVLEPVVGLVQVLPAWLHVEDVGTAHRQLRSIGERPMNDKL